MNKKEGFDQLLDILKETDKYITDLELHNLQLAYEVLRLKKQIHELGSRPVPSEESLAASSLQESHQQTDP